MKRTCIGKTDIVGININFEEPQNSDLILEIDKLTEEEAFIKIKNYIVNKYGDEYIDM